MKYAEAAKLAGSERWLKFHIKAGNITPIRRGTAKNSPIYYSRYEIAALKKAEVIFMLPKEMLKPIRVLYLIRMRFILKEVKDTKS
ncbi:MAG: hypothetical protein LBU84_01025 [Prevotella sp.]|nr:hypothetical protein [Prevotella sp.]